MGKLHKTFPSLLWVAYHAGRPFYVRGCAVGCALSGLIVILSLGLHLKLEQENRKRDCLYGQVEENMHVDVTQGGDKNTSFRYLT